MVHAKYSLRSRPCCTSAAVGHTASWTETFTLPLVQHLVVVIKNPTAIVAVSYHPRLLFERKVVTFPPFPPFSPPNPSNFAFNDA